MLHLIALRVIILFYSLFILNNTCKSQETVISDSTFYFASQNNTEYVMSNLNLNRGAIYKLHNNDNINFGVIENSFGYIIVKLISKDSLINCYLSIDNTSLDTVLIYRVYDNGINKLMYKGGDLIPFENDRKYIWHTSKVEIGCTPSYYLIAVKSSGKNINIKYELLAEKNLENKYRLHERIILLYAGAISLIILTIFFSFFLLKKKVLLAYLCYIIFLSGWIFAHYGYTFAFLHPNITILNEIVKPITNVGAFIFLIITLKIIFKKQLEKKRWLNYALVISLIALIVNWLLFSFLLNLNLSDEFRYKLLLAWHLNIFIALALIILTPFVFFKNSTSSKIFSLAVMVVSAMAIVQLLSNFGVINNYFINEHGMTLGSLMEISIMATGLFYNVFEEKRNQENQVLFLEQQQAETFRKLITVQDTERKRIANDLHDNIGPMLVSLKINFARIIKFIQPDKQKELIEKTENIITDSISEIRSIAHNLMPKGLSSKGFIVALKDYSQSIQHIYHIKIDFQHEIQSIFHLELQTNLYRIICELLLNSAKHSKAQIIFLHISSNKYLISVTLKDDGKGFNIINTDSNKSFGLQSVESRVSYMKGNISIQSEPEKGTLIELQIPL